jgi:hypothetical protein
MIFAMSAVSPFATGQRTFKNRRKLPTTDMANSLANVGDVPFSNQSAAQQNCHYWITL